MSTDMPRSFLRPAPLVLGLTLLAGIVAPVAATPLKNGQWLELQGLVTDSTGTPLEGARVVFEARRRYFSIRHFRQRAKDLRQVATTVDARGEYRVRWLWDDYFNAFQLGVAVSVSRPDGEQLRFLKKVDVTSRLEQSNPLITPLVVEDAALFHEIREFEASLDTEDELKVYRETGYPDKVKAVDIGPRNQASWWYFSLGKTYRFTDGELMEVVSFEPVQSF